MWRAEFRTVLKYTGYWLAMVALAGAVSLVGLFSRQGWLQVGLLFYASAVGLFFFFPVLLGHSAFREERAQRGMEYALSLPFSRSRLQVYKLVPRLAALAVVSTLFLLWLVPMRRLLIILPDRLPALSWETGILLLALFILSLPFSLWQENILATLILTAFSFILYVVLVALPFLGVHFALRVFRVEALPLGIFAEKILGRGFEDVSASPLFIGTALILLVSYFLALVLTVHTMDLRPRRSWRNYTSKLVLLGIAGVVVSTAFIGFAYKPKPPYYYLMDEGHLVEDRPGLLCIRTPDGRRYSFPGGLPYIETLGNDGHNIYFWKYSAGKIWAFKTDTHQWRTIYSLPSDYSFRGPFIIRSGGIDFIIKSSGSKFKSRTDRLISLDTRTHEIQHDIMISSKDKRIWGFRIIGSVLGAERRFWLAHGWNYSADLRPIYRIWEDGMVEDLMESQGENLLVRGYMLSISEEGLSFIDVRQPSYKLLGNISGRFSRFVYRYIDENAADENQVLLWNNEEGKNYCLDVSTGSLSEVRREPQDDFGKRKLQFSKNLCYAYSFDKAQRNDLLAIYRLADCRLEPLKTIDRGDPRRETDGEWFSSAGVVVRRKGKIRAYLAPDMKEIHFK